MSDDSSKPVNIKEFKKKRKIKKIIEDLKKAIKVYNLSINALKSFSSYMIVMETISVLQGNKTLLEIHLKKYENMLKSYKND